MTKTPLTLEQQRFRDSFGLTDDQMHERIAAANAENGATEAEEAARSEPQKLATMTDDERAVARGFGLTDAQFMRRRNDSLADDFNVSEGR